MTLQFQKWLNGLPQLRSKFRIIRTLQFTFTTQITLVIVLLFSIGNVVKHRHFNFRGVIYDVDFEFNNSEEWYQSIPKDVRPRKDQPFYHLLAESNDVTYEAYVSEQNLLLDKSKEPVKHPLIEEIFSGKRGSNYFKLSN